MALRESATPRRRGGDEVVASVNEEAPLKDGVLPLGGEQPLTDWVVGLGARVSDAVIVRGATSASPRGLFAVRAVEEGDELIMLPERLQLGVTSLAAGADLLGLQQMVGELIVGFQTIRCAVALCAEGLRAAWACMRRQGADGEFTLVNFKLERLAHSTRIAKCHITPASRRLSGDPQSSRPIKSSRSRPQIRCE